jgi:serine/threonine protein kinase
MLNGRYTIKPTLLGSGGNGDVWLAYDEVLLIDVAIKIVRNQI